MGSWLQQSCNTHSSVCLFRPLELIPRSGVIGHITAMFWILSYFYKVLQGPATNSHFLPVVYKSTHLAPSSPTLTLPMAEVASCPLKSHALVLSPRVVAEKQPPSHKLHFPAAHAFAFRWGHVTGSDQRKVGRSNELAHINLWHNPSSEERQMIQWEVPRPIGGNRTITGNQPWIRTRRNRVSLLCINADWFFNWGAGGGV